MSGEANISHPTRSGKDIELIVTATPTETHYELRGGRWRRASRSTFWNGIAILPTRLDNEQCVNGWYVGDLCSHGVCAKTLRVFRHREWRLEKKDRCFSSRRAIHSSLMNLMLFAYALIQCVVSFHSFNRVKSFGQSSFQPYESPPTTFRLFA
jgi:hypothetical protein